MVFATLPAMPSSFLFGLIAGSFLNVCIHRLPKGESIAFPGSHCPCCQHPIAWFDNIPLLSYLILKGRCRHCREAISPRYPLVELGNAILWCLAAYQTQNQPALLLQQLFASALLALSLIDLQEMIIPDEINLFIAGLGLVALITLPEPTWWERLFGVLAGGGTLLLLAELSLRLMHKEGMGGGDIKLMAAAGLFLGWKSALISLILASFIALGGVLLALLLGHKLKRSAPIPFGPSLAAACLISYWWGESLMQWYMGLLL